MTEHGRGIQQITCLLAWQADAAHQRLKTRIGAHGVSPGLSLQKLKVVRALLVSFFEPPQGLILLAQSPVDRRDVEGRDIPFLG